MAGKYRILVRVYRKIMGFSVPDFAKKIGVHLPIYRAWENDEIESVEITKKTMPLVKNVPATIEARLLACIFIYGMSIFDKRSKTYIGCSYGHYRRIIRGKAEVKKRIEIFAKHLLDFEEFKKEALNEGGDNG